MSLGIYYKVKYDRQLTAEQCAAIIDSRKLDAAASVYVVIAQDADNDNNTSIVIYDLFARMAWVHLFCVQSFSKHNLSLDTTWVEAEPSSVDHLFKKEI